MKKQLSDVICELHVPSFEVAKQFYGDLGFNVLWERKPTEKTKGYMVMKRDQSVLCFYCGTNEVYDHSYFKQFPSETKRGYAVEIVIPIQGLELLYKKIYKKYSSQIFSAFERRFYYPDFRIVDPFGFYLRFVEKYNWVDTRNPDGSPKPEYKKEAEMFVELMRKGTNKQS
ncbi:MAG: hypothetical protein UR68_C0005G0025 [Candidatus Roizmanbacteria bacterium GW2011_GWA2_35_19]|uniref:VOC domain-containing protein n=2 Tax=Candidatus Roizmaniibacteriota TaxID=1752723 RepID=A0A0G0CB27_9BACT|nr:MAG: hypothetical protein UR63_C0005G0009 [Candidatus Roizmanbacteria bacterium GW2011_GWC2_35_12]KKP73291.1 MAG: hypothetical protein UR68_C0005G0025 [Candidatus Roizmanbacteria bacterium GW2011_GWA2_35_19]